LILDYIKRKWLFLLIVLLLIILNIWVWFIDEPVMEADVKPVRMAYEG